LLEKKGPSLKHGTSRLIPRRVRVDDDGEDSVGADKSELSLDQDWSTISWNDEMVTSACETLYAKFQEPNFLLDEQKRTKAIAMFEKLVENNAPAEVFVKTNIENMINSSTSRLLRGGRSISAFNFLYVIKIAQKKCCHELTSFRFAFKAVEMMLLESRLAAILIQHTFRSSKLKHKIKETFKNNPKNAAIISEMKEIENKKNGEMKIVKKGRKVLEFTEFGTDMEMRRLKERPIDARSADLRNRWRSVHSNKQKIFGSIGPVHIGPIYTKILLEIIAFLVSDEAGADATSNRVDVVSGFGCILLAVLFSNPYGAYASTVSSILASISAAGESLHPFLNCGCVNQCVKYMKYLKDTFKDIIKPLDLDIQISVYEDQSLNKSPELNREISLLSTETYNTPIGSILNMRNASQKISESNQSMYTEGTDIRIEKLHKKRAKEKFDAGIAVVRLSYVHCVEMILHISEHAAGIFRAAQRVTNTGCPVKRGSGRKGRLSDIDYRSLSQALDGLPSGPNGDWDVSRTVLHMLGDRALIVEMVASFVETVHYDLLRVLLKCLFTLLCCECYSVVIREIISFGARGLYRLIELLEENDKVISGYSLSIILQICTLQSGREALSQAGNVGKCLKQLLDYNDYENNGFQRGVLVSAALCRQQEMWALDSYDISMLTGKRMASEDALKRLVLTDLLLTMKGSEDTQHEDLALVDLNILPVDHNRTLQMSIMVESLQAREIINYVCRPCDENYFQALPWDESIAGCVVLEGFTSHKDTIEKIFSPGVIHYLGKCLRLVKVLFLGPPMSDRRTVLLMSGVAAASNALSNICAYCAELDVKSHSVEVAKVIRDSDLMTAVRFFITTLSVSHPDLEEGTKSLQQVMGLSVIRFFRSFTCMLLEMDKNNDTEKSGKTETSLLEESHISTNKSQLIGLLPAGLAVTQLLKCLIKIYGKTERMLEILDEICKLLDMLTIPKEGAHMAIHDWKIVDALRVHLPGPLSGVGILGVKDILYVTGIGALPASFFSVCRNLSQMDTFKIIALNDGFLRRALEKVMLVAPLIKHNFSNNSVRSERSTDRGNSLSKSTHRVDIRTCLQFITMCANFQNENCGSVNDLIFSAEYAIIRVCRDMVASDVCPRDDPLLLIAAETIAVLSKDNLRLFKIFLDLEILELVLYQFQLLADGDVSVSVMSDQLLTSCIDILGNVVSGLWSDELADVVGCLREPLSRVGRIRPQLTVKVRDTHWAMTKATAAYRRQKDSQEGRRSSPGAHEIKYINDKACDMVDTVSQESVKGNTYVSTQVNDIGAYHASFANMNVSANEVEREEFPDSFTKNTYVSTPPLKPPSERSKKGTYDLCGVTACGSLRSAETHDHTHPESHDYDHGLYAYLAMEEREAQLLKLPVVQEGLGAVSKVSARESELEERMRRSKIGHGFTARPQSSIEIEQNYSTLKASKSLDKKERSTFGDFSFNHLALDQPPPRAAVSSSSTSKRYVQSTYDPYTAKVGSDAGNREKSREGTGSKRRNRVGLIETVSTDEFPEYGGTRPMMHR